MNPILPTAALACIVSGAAPAPAQDVARPPNVLFVAVDDLNDWIGCLGGHPQARTPNLDRLAAQGVLFTNAYCAAPSCNPSRTAVFTGLAPLRSGLLRNDQRAEARGRAARVQVEQKSVVMDVVGRGGRILVPHDNSIRPWVAVELTDRDPDARAPGRTGGHVVHRPPPADRAVRGQIVRHPPVDPQVAGLREQDRDHEVGARVNIELGEGAPAPPG